MDVDTLKATFEEYQGFAAAGKDARFDRAAETMVPLDNGPYYAVSIYPGSCSTLGGPMKNENAQVLDPAQNPIPRLYAAGCFGNFQSHTYGITGGNNAYRRPPCLRPGELGRRVIPRALRLTQASKAAAPCAHGAGRPSPCERRRAASEMRGEFHGK